MSVFGRLGVVAPRMIPAVRISYYSQAQRVSLGGPDEPYLLKYVTSYNRPEGVVELYAFLNQDADIEALLHVIMDDAGNVGYDMTKETANELTVYFDGTPMVTWAMNSGDINNKSRWVHMVQAV